MEAVGRYAGRLERGRYTGRLGVGKQTDRRVRRAAGGQEGW